MGDSLYSTPPGPSRGAPMPERHSMPRDSMTRDYQRRRATARFEHHIRQLDRAIGCNAPREHLDTTVELLDLLLAQMGPVTVEVEYFRQRLDAARYRIEHMTPPSFRRSTPVLRDTPALRLVTPVGARQ